MQGFNKYYPPDYDPQAHSSLNAYRGKHALGDRARKIDQGILITRFELPFNIWCESCNNHIGMGVRYNAEKKKIGSYFSTPIFSFRCKCHLCDNWFTIETDPKNTRYVVTSGARKKEEDWDPEENGGFAVHETDPNAPPPDPLAALEKSTEAQNHVAKVQAPRIEQLQALSEHYNSDPYEHSRRVRKLFREEKKVEKKRKDADDAVRDRYGLSKDIPLLADDEAAVSEAHEQWAKSRQEYLLTSQAKRRRLEAEGGPLISRASGSRQPLSSRSKSNSKAPTNNALSSLRTRILQNSARQSDITRLKPPDKGLGILTKR